MKSLILWIALHVDQLLLKEDYFNLQYRYIIESNIYNPTLSTLHKMQILYKNLIIANTCMHDDHIKI